MLDEGVDVKALDLPAAEQLYTRATTALPTDPEFAERAGVGWSLLQAGDDADPGHLAHLVDISLTGFNDAYDRIERMLTDDHLAGESMYNDDLAVGGRRARGRRHRGDRRRGSVRVRRGLRRPDDRPQDATVGYGYSATDLAAIRHRVRDLKADRMIYVTDVRQADHFALVFAVARKAG